MKSLVVSVCITAVTDMAAVSLLVFFFWCSSGVLMGSSGVLLCYIGTPEEPRRTQKEKNTSPPL